MELSENPNYLDAYWTKDGNGNKEFFIINEAIISKLCILGEEFEPCFEGGSIEAPKIEFSLEDSFKEQLLSMMTELTNILNEGGAKMVDNDKTPVVEEPVVDPVVDADPAPVADSAEEPAVDPIVEEPAADPVVDADSVAEPADADPAPVAEFAEGKKDDDKEVCPECGKPVDECTCEEDKKKKEYVLEEIPEYVELQSNHVELETKYSTLLSDYEALKAEKDTLAEFKANADKKEKEALIASFYMLSDELKKDVVDNIDTYSLEDIEAKLSILCVRNKVSFDLENDNKEADPISYNLNDTGSSNDNVPEWIKAIQSHVAEN